ncbi:RDD family protein [Xanthobacter autotrophicus]|uniref:RDD family protein n=1 Tax=Xanthobacter autotrophicus TaxID=280 RepID=UPI0024A6E66C|nr:RDD family protein [Xanthobacter autotrophicus]MDI4655255.1 RDD family protein [Xanthobacter autotrophicus]
MSNTSDTSRQPPSYGYPDGARPSAYDPVTQPEYFEGVLSRRLVAFLVDAILILGGVVLFYVLVLLMGLVTFGLSWIAFLFVWPTFVIAALAYNAITLGSPASATLGMRLMDLEMRTWYGAPCYSVLAAVHAVCFWVSVSIFTPFVLLVALFNDRRRLLHDFLVGTVVVNNTLRADALRRRP